MNRLPYLCIALIGVIGLIVGPAVAAPKAQHHHNGQQLLGEKIKTNGAHVIDKKGPFTTSVEVRGGKIAGVHVKHDKKMTQLERRSIFIQAQYVGTSYIGYSYIDEYGDEDIYWFPYDMILD